MAHIDGRRRFARSPSRDLDRSAKRPTSRAGRARAATCAVCSKHALTLVVRQQTPSLLAGRWPMRGWSSVRGDAGGFATTAIQAADWLVLGALIVVCVTCIALVTLVEKAE